MKILVTGTAGFIGYHLAKKLLERGDVVVGIDNINNYYDVNLKYGRLKELGINKENISKNSATPSDKYEKHTFYKMDLADKEARESKYWIDLLIKTDYLDINENHVLTLQKDIEEIIKLLTSIVKSSQGK